MTTALSTRRAMAAAAAALALTLAGCTAADPQGDVPELGPIDELFQSLYGDWDEDDYTAQTILMEELIAECMADEGFQYVPADYSSQTAIAHELDEEWGTLEFAKKYGYGATTQPWDDHEEEEADPQEWTDPNTEYVESMSQSEQIAYWTALYGDQEFEFTDDDSEWEYSWEDAGCQGWAQHEAYGSQLSPFEDERFVALQQELDAMWTAATEDPRLAALGAEWAACMTDAGYEGLSQIGDAENLIYDEVNAIWENAYAGIPFDATQAEWDAVQESIDAEMAAITEREIPLATADYTCRTDVKYEETQRRISIEHQQRFYDAHADELEAWAASFATDD